MGQKVFFNNDNKLVVQTDNGIYTNGNFECALKGDFTISAQDVARLIAEEDKGSCVIKKRLIESRDGYETIHFILNKEDSVEKTIERILENRRVLEERIVELNKKIEEIEELYDIIKYKIIDHNNKKWYKRFTKIAL
ncbi:MAG: hypothetical protein ACI35S_06705 [Anaeroplasma sp.]